MNRTDVRFDEYSSGHIRLIHLPTGMCVEGDRKKCKRVVLMKHLSDKVHATPWYKAQNET